MCSGAIVLSRIDTVVYGARDPKFGACGSIFTIPTEKKLNHQANIVEGVMAEAVSDLMKLFFRQIREKKERKVGPN